MIDWLCPRSITAWRVLCHNLFWCSESPINIVRLKFACCAFNRCFITLKPKCSSAMNAESKTVKCSLWCVFAKITFLHHDGRNESIIDIICVSGFNNKLTKMIMGSHWRFVSFQECGNNMGSCIATFYNGRNSLSLQLLRNCWGRSDRNLRRNNCNFVCLSHDIH